MEKHLKNGLIFAVVFTVVFLTLNTIVLTGKNEPKILSDISNVMLVPLAWFWDLIGVSACQAMGYIVFIILSVPVYYFIIGFFTGVLFSAVIEAVITAKENKRYSKGSSELENDSSE